MVASMNEYRPRVDAEGSSEPRESFGPPGDRHRIAALIDYIVEERLAAVPRCEPVLAVPRRYSLRIATCEVGETRAMTGVFFGSEPDRSPLTDSMLN